MGQRISAMTHLKSGKPIEPKKEYTVAGWASVNEDTEGPPVWDLVERFIAAEKTVRIAPNTSVKISGG
jgi:sulfur-oxidizing protein SoxB